MKNILIQPINTANQLVVFNATATLFVHHRMMFELNQAVHEAFSNNNLIIIIAIIIIVVVGVFAIFRQNMLQFCSWK